MAFRRRGEEDPPPDYMVGYDIKVKGLNLENFTVKFFHGGYWFTQGGNRQYENGRIAYFDFCNFNGFSRLHLEEMAQVLGYIFPFGFLFRPKGKSLNMGFRVVGESEVMLMLHDLRGRNYREANIYLVLPDPVFAVKWRLDEEAVRHVPQPEAAKLDKCILEELPSDSELVPDVVVNPRGHHDPNDAFYNKPTNISNAIAANPPTKPPSARCGTSSPSNDGSTRSPEVEITGYKEVEESPRARRLRQRRRLRFSAQSQPQPHTQPEPNIEPETILPTPQPEPQTDPHPETEPYPEIETQPNFEPHPEVEESARAEADFVLHEEQYCGEPEVERHGYTQPDSCDWWGRHTELVPDALFEDEGDIGEETEMGSVHSDEENESAGPYKLSYNPDTNLENLEWKPYMEFASIEVLRKTIRAYFIHQNKEYILKANDSKKFRVKCSAKGCPWMLYAYVKQDGKTFRGQKNKGGMPQLQNPNKETLKRRKRREMEKARKARQAAEGGGPGSAEARGSNT
ncbi:hypothetical protein F8388_004577 [Cannabis sativa]|uniref:Transposase MuDR plant domain-containing protein n=1 Tax=Cannabis sativa TaxID=3483 RepID=A0A7J6GN49_CANSA|nr:hypothetical protein F8388_004577 [Cannabis sativa]